MTTRKMFILGLICAIIFTFAAAYCVVSPENLYEKEYYFGKGPRSVDVDVPLKDSYSFKFRAFEADPAKIKDAFSAYINGNALVFSKIDSRDDYVRFHAEAGADDVKAGVNEISFSATPSRVALTVENHKKTCLRDDWIYIGDFYLMTSSGNWSSGYPLSLSIIIGVILAFVWMGTSIILSKAFYYSAAKVYRLNLVMLIFIAFLLFGLKLSFYFAHFPIALGLNFAVPLFIILFLAVKGCEVLFFGRSGVDLRFAKTAVWMKDVENRSHLGIVIVSVMAIVYTAVFFTLQVLRHRGFMPSMDTNGMIQLAYNMVCGRFWECQGGGFQLDTYLRYHLQPVLYLLVPLYALFKSNLVFYFVQTAVIASGAFPVYWIAREKLKNKGYAVIFSAAYLLYPSIHNCTMYGFHLEEFSIGLGLFAFYFLMKKKRLLFVICCLLLMSLKENIAAISFMLGIYAFIKGERKVGILVAVLSALWFYLSVFVIIPHYTPGEGITYSESFFRNIGWRRDAGLAGVAGNIYAVVRSTFDSPLKAHFLYHLFAPFVFIPFIAPDILFLAAPVFAQLLISGYVRFHDITIHYQGALLPFIVIAAIYGFKRISALKDHIAVKLSGRSSPWFERILIIILLFSTVFFALKNLAPAHRPNYFVPGVFSLNNRDDLIKEYLDAIPPEVSAAVPMKYYEYLAGRRLQYYIFPEVVKKFNPDIVLLDTRICWPSYAEYRYNDDVLRYLENSALYRCRLNREGMYIYEKKGSPRLMKKSGFDSTFFSKNKDQTGGCNFDGSVDIPESGKYQVVIKVSSEPVLYTSEQNGYDSFENLPNHRGVIDVAQSFTAPESPLRRIELLARRLGDPRLKLSIRKDTGGIPSGDELFSVTAPAGEGTLYKFSWIGFNVSPVRFVPGEKYWIVMTAEGDRSHNKYEIAAFNKAMKKDYYDQVYCRYDKYPDQWKEPYIRDVKSDYELGNSIDGFVLRLIGPESKKVSYDVNIGRKKAASGSVSGNQKGSVRVIDDLDLPEGPVSVNITGNGNFSLESVEFIKEK
ncbi:DUF2079 domain-containing protein [Candidatus Auribacterota bacterium]